MSVPGTVITVSDRCAAGIAEDASGPILLEALAQVASPVYTALVADGEESVSTAIADALAAGSRVVITTGGTGIGPRDKTPEGTATHLTTTLPGIPEALRAADATVPGAALSRGLAGLTADGALVINVPGSRGAATTAAAVLPRIIEHALDQLAGGGHEAHV